MPAICPAPLIEFHKRIHLQFEAVRGREARLAVRNAEADTFLSLIPAG